MTAADRPSRRDGARDATRVRGPAAGGAGGGAGGRNGNGAGRTSGPVVPARREQRIERSPATTVRQAGEVRGRARAPLPPDGTDVVDESWSGALDRALPMGPGVARSGLDDRGRTTLPVPMTAPSPTTGTVSLASIGDITYDRGSGELPAHAPPLPPFEVRAVDTSPVDVVPAAAPVEVPQSAAAPVARPAPPARPRRSMLRGRTRVRRVSRVVRRVDAWSVLKVSVIFYALAYAVLLVAGVLLWNLALTTGTVANVEGFVRELFGLRVFKIDGDKLYRASWPIGVFLAVAGTGLNVTVAVMFNLITDLVGGVRVTVLEEEVRVVESGSHRRLGRRRPPAPDAVASDAVPPEAG